NGIHSLSDLINFNEQNAQNVMPYFQQEQLIAAEATNGLDDPDYIAALKECRRLTREEGIDKALLDHSCCALVAPTTSTPWAIDFLNGDNRIGGSSCLAAVSGYPSVTVPMGYVSGLPTGLSFIGRAWEDYLIIDLAYAFEQISMVRCPAGNPERFLN
ncbi:MAG: amidase, partial [Pseudomonadota bacterium]|nr:amidase [Pseudomonadota bacterium]